MNLVVLTGRLSKDVEFGYTKTNTAQAKFTVAVDKGFNKEKKKEAEAKGFPTADFINCVAYGKTAELINQYTAKGLMIAVNGSIQSNSWENEDGTRGYWTGVVAYSVEFLEFKGKNTNNEQGNLDGFVEDTSGFKPPF